MDRYEAGEEALDARCLGRIVRKSREAIFRRKREIFLRSDAQLSIHDGYAEQLTASIVSTRNGTPSTTMKIPRDTVSVFRRPNISTRCPISSSARSVTSDRGQILYGFPTSAGANRRALYPRQGT